MRQQLQLIRDRHSDARPPKIESQNPDSSRWPCSSLQFRRKFADQVFDLFRFVPMTNQKRVRGSHDDEIMHSE